MRFNIIFVKFERPSIGLCSENGTFVLVAMPTLIKVDDGFERDTYVPMRTQKKTIRHNVTAVNASKQVFPLWLVVSVSVSTMLLTATLLTTSTFLPNLQNISINLEYLENTLKSVESLNFSRQETHNILNDYRYSLFGRNRTLNSSVIFFTDCSKIPERVTLEGRPIATSDEKCANFKQLVSAIVEFWAKCHSLNHTIVETTKANDTDTDISFGFVDLNNRISHHYSREKIQLQSLQSIKSVNEHKLILNIRLNSKLNWCISYGNCVDNESDMRMALMSETARVFGLLSSENPKSVVFNITGTSTSSSTTTPSVDQSESLQNDCYVLRTKDKFNDDDEKN